MEFITEQKQTIIQNTKDLRIFFQLAGKILLEIVIWQYISKKIISNDFLHQFTDQDPTYINIVLRSSSWFLDQTECVEN